MEKTDHIMLIGEGANLFATEMGVPMVNSSQLVTPKSRRLWEEFSNFNNVTSDVFKSGKVIDEGHETVGAVARDMDGNFAAATSTGGITWKVVGRVGDSPLIGSGAYCSNDLGGVSCTGHGEPIAKVVLAHRVLSQLEKCEGKTVPSLEEAMKEALEYMLKRVGGRGGMIGISRNGEIAKWHNTPRMSWASVDAKGCRDSGVCV
jgi:beta-aspartyl-peptidase (threonine type)